MKPRVSALIAVVLLCISVPGQSPASKGRPRTVHVQGTTFGPDGDDVVSGTRITFHSEQVTRIVIANDSGFYQTDLPVGLYTMTAEAPGIGFRKYSRPLFRVAQQPTLTLNVTLYGQRNNCDVIVLDGDRKDACGGEELSPAPSDDGLPFQLSIRYSLRSLGDRGYVYSGDMEATNSYTPVTVAYNLITLEAKHVTYDAERRTLEANGHVAFLDESGTTHHSATLTLKIENGRATPVE